MIIIRKRGLFVAGVGAAIFGISILVADSLVLSDFAGPAGFSADAVFEGMFDEIKSGITITPGTTEHISYDVKSEGAPLMWAIHIVGYTQDDRLSITSANMYGDIYGQFVQAEEMKFEIVESAQAGPLDVAITNSGNEYVEVSVMFAEDPEKSEMFTDPDSILNKLIIPLAVTGILVVTGLIVVVTGMIIFLVDMKRRQSTNRFGDWSSGR